MRLINDRKSPGTESDALRRSRSANDIRDFRGGAVRGERATTPTAARADASSVFEAARSLLQMKRDQMGRHGDAVRPEPPGFGLIEGSQCGASEENCYLYAINRRSEDDVDGFPGQIGSMTAAIETLEAKYATVEGFISTLIDDGLTAIADPTHAIGAPVVAAYHQAPGDGGDEDDAIGDFHFARLDADGGWSEKFGDEAPERIERDPRAPHDVGYSFVGFFTYGRAPE